jgi:tetratricopeptide (TPR) repeat protein
MKITIDQAMQQGVTAQSQGKFQEAEQFYYAILQSQPTHPEANHNLGLIAISVNEAEKALALFKTALEANPKIGQFWLSYIDALIKNNQIETAKVVLKKGKNTGLFGNRFDNLDKQLNANSVGPSESQIHNILEQYNNGQYDEAEKLALLNTQQFPEHLFSWKVLGAIFKDTGRLSEALNANQKAIQIAPDNADTHYDLGNSLKELGRLDEAEDSLRQAIALNNDYAEAHNNLASTLQELDRIEEAEAALRQAILIKPDFVESHYNLSLMLQEQGRFNEAHSSLKQAIILKPDYAEAHNQLGILLKELNQLDEAVVSLKQAIILKSDYAEAHNNLASTLQNLGGLEEAEVSLRQAILLQPDYVEAHYNLGYVLKERGRLNEAASSLRKAIKLKHDFFEAYSNLGITLQELGKLEEAEITFMHAIKLNTDSPDIYNNLGVTLKRLGRLDEAAGSFKRALKLKPDYNEVKQNLSATYDYMNDLDKAILQLENILESATTDTVGLKAAVSLAIFKFLEGDLTICKTHLLASSRIEQELSSDFKNYIIYREYLLKIVNWHENIYSSGIDSSTDKKLYVIGESHSLVSHQLNVRHSDNNFLCKSLLIKGCKQWDIGNSIRNQCKTKFERVVNSLPKASDVLLAIGEIDCRLDSGIIKHNDKYPEKDIKKLVVTTVDNYINYIYELNNSRENNIIIQGVPCPNINIRNISKKKVTVLIELIKMFNYELKNKSKAKGFGFLDLHKLTDRGDGFSNTVWHIDDFHISPDGMLEAWRAYYSA